MTMVPLHLLLVDDDPANAERVIEALRGDGFEPHCRRIASEDEFRTALRPTLDVILSSATTAGFDAPVALRILDRYREWDLPFILVSGTAADERTAAIMRDGATDVVAQEHLSRLGPAVRRALEERRLREAERSAQTHLLRSEQLTHSVLSANDAHVAVLDSDGTIVACNRAWRDFAQDNGGMAHETGVGINYLDVCRRAMEAGDPIAGEVLAGIQAVLSARRSYFTREYTCDAPAERRWFVVQVVPASEQEGGAIVSHINITAQRLAEDALREREVGFRLLFAANPAPMWVYDLETLTFIEVNDAAVAQYGYSRDEFLSMDLTQIRPAEDIPRLLADLLRPAEGIISRGVWRHLTRDGRFLDVSITSHRIQYRGRPAMLSVMLDETERLRLERERELLRSEADRRASLAEEMALLTFKLSTAQSQAEMIEAVTGSAATITGAESVSVGLLEGDLLRCAHRSGLRESDLLEDVSLTDRSIVAHVLRTRQSYRSNDLANDPLSDHATDALVGLRNQIAVPLTGGEGHVLGVLTVFNKRGGAPFTLEDQALLHTVAAHTGLAIERARAREALRHSEQRHRALMEEAADGIIIASDEGRFVDANAQACRILDLSNEEICQRSIGDLIRGDQGRRLQEQAAALKAGETICTERSLARGDGTLVHVDHRVTRLQDGRLLVVFHDITERKEAERSIRFQAALLEAVGQAVIATDLDGQITYMNAAAERLYDWPRDQALGRPICEITVPQQDLAQAAAIMQQLATGLMWSGEFMVRRHDGSVFPAQVTDSPLFDEAGAVAGIIGVSQDITERKNAEAAARHLAAIVESSEVAIFSTDRYGTFTSWNTGAEQIFGYTAAQVIGKHSSMLDETDRNDRSQNSRRELAEVHSIQRSEGKAIRSDGRVIDVVYTVSHLRNQDGEHYGYSIIARDVTDQRRLEQRLRHAERLSAVGELAAGVAHEVNNPLAAISLNAELLGREQLSEQGRQDLQVIQREARRAGDIIRALLRFSRQREPVLEPIALSAPLEEALGLTADRLKRFNITLVRRLQTVPRVQGDRDQLVQVFLNLINNAIDAMQSYGAGTLTVRIRSTRSGVELSIADTGCGITAAAQEHLFDPFFTTKEVGKGTGMGLSVSHSIVEAHGGAITVQNVRPHGARFRVVLPALREPRLRGKRTGKRSAIKHRSVVIVLEQVLAAEAMAAAVEVLGRSPAIVTPHAVDPVTLDAAAAIVLDSGTFTPIATVVESLSSPPTLIFLGDAPPAAPAHQILRTPYRLADLERVLESTSS